MKLIAASATLLAAINAQTIDFLVQELVNKVYQVSDDGTTHTFNAAPYFQAVYECQGDGFEAEGTFGNGNGVISFTEKAYWGGDEFTYDVTSEGTTKSTPWAAIYPVEFHDDEFSSSASLRASAEGVSWENKGNINGSPFSQAVSLAMNEITMTKSKVSAEIEINRNADISSAINPYWQSMLMPSGSTTANIKATARTACSENPMSRSCSAKLVITGENNGSDFGKNVAKYSVQSKKAQLSVSHNGNEVFWLAITGIDTMQVLALKYKLNGGKAVLAVQIVGPAGMEALAVAGQDFITPFAAFFSNMNSGEDAFRAVVYADSVFSAVQGQNYFNFYPVIKETQFESESLAAALGVSSMQKAASDMCQVINAQVEGLLAEFAPVVTQSRSYIHEITGPSGENDFNNWFAFAM